MKRVSIGVNTIYAVCLSILITGVGLSSASAADSAIPSIETLSTSWKFACSDKGLLDYLKSEFMYSIQHGLNEVSRLNPNFSNQMLKNMQGRRLVISCKASKGEFVEANAKTSSKRPIITLGRIALTIPKKKETVLSLGKPLQHCLIADKHKDPSKDKMRARKFVSEAGEGKLYNASLSRSFKEDCHQTLFHEFLHFAEADNMPVKDHNSVGSISSWRDLLKAQKLDDVVYSCARTAFRYGTANVTDNSVAIPNALSRQSFIQSCTTCSLASGEPKKVTVLNDSDLIQQAGHMCGLMYDNIPHLEAGNSGSASHSESLR